MALPWSHPGPPVGPARGEDHVPGLVTSGGNGSSVDPGTSGGVEEVSPSGSTGSPCSPCSSESPEDRKSTRLNSSHANISYAVFCLKKKKIPKNIRHKCINN